MVDFAFELGTIVGGSVGWNSCRNGSTNIQRAKACLPIGAALLVLGWWSFASWGAGFNFLGGGAIAYGVAFFLYRLFTEHNLAGRA